MSEAMQTQSQDHAVEMEKMEEMERKVEVNSATVREREKIKTNKQKNSTHFHRKRLVQRVKVIKVS